MLKPTNVNETRDTTRFLTVPTNLKGVTKIGPVTIRQIAVEEDVVTPFYTGKQLRWIDDSFVETT